MTKHEQKIVEDIREHFGLEVENLIRMGLLPQVSAKKWLVRALYFKYAKTGRTYLDIKLDLSVEYNISVSAIEKLVYRDSRYGIRDAR
ncbi:MAG: hypothetical protein ISS19_17275 [Bacteroidales bacterium]|nr:hypothetical protein [Bacteroidales bacterium]